MEDTLLHPMVGILMHYMSGSKDSTLDLTEASAEFPVEERDAIKAVIRVARDIWLYERGDGKLPDKTLDTVQRRAEDTKRKDQGVYKEGLVALFYAYHEVHFLVRPNFTRYRIYKHAAFDIGP